MNDWNDTLAAVSAQSDQTLATMRSLEEPMRRFMADACTYYDALVEAGVDRNTRATMLITTALGVVLTAE